MATNPRSSTLVARLLCSAAILMLPGMALANPAGGKVTAGSATISQPNAANTTVTQKSEKAVINWQSFSIGQDETTSFNQPDASAITLNRVTGVDPSSIMGNLTANGQVWLINPNGIAFGKSARVDVAGLLATTIDIKDQDFMSGNYQFSGLTNGSAMVTNAGHITIRDAGLGALVAPGVENSGFIEADLGQVQLSSTDAFTVDFYGDGLFNITLDKQVTQAIKRQDGTPPSAAVTNSGTLIANGGKILLTANAASSVVNNAINMTGYAQATSASQSQDGSITLDGGSDGTVQVAGTLDASGKSTGETGGAVDVTGHNVQLASTAKVDVSGDTGGGTALIGGDRHGGGTLAHASTTSIASGATINADAITKGNGGKVVVWSDNQTDYQGAISAKGAASGGDGGSAEVSSHGLLNFNGLVDLSAPIGSTGTLLLDPASVSTQSTGTTNYNDVSTIEASTIENALLTANVAVNTSSGDITIASTLSWANANSLTFSAYGNIIINDSVVIANTNAGDLVLRADNTGTGIGTVIFNGVSRVNWAGSTGTISLFYNPPDNPSGSVVNGASYATPTDFSSYVLTSASESNQFVPYMLVNTVYDLQNIDNNLSGDYALGRDINASTFAFSSLGELFEGMLNGEGHTVSNLTISASPDSLGYGLFVEIDAGGIVENINLTNVLVNSPAVGGGIAAWNLGTIRNVSVTGSVSGSQVGGIVGGNAAQSVGGQFFQGVIDLASADVTVQGSTGDQGAGGLVGENQGIITNSHATGDVRGAGDCISDGCSGGIAGGVVGGLVGSNSGTISNSYATGDVTGTNASVGGLVGINSPIPSFGLTGEIDQSYATGTVSSNGQDSNAGGLVGNLDGGSIAESYSTGNVTGLIVGSGTYPVFDWVGGLVGVVQIGSISDSYSTGRVEGTASGGGSVVNAVGGLIGTVDTPGSALITNAYWDIDTSGQASSAAGTGITTVELTSALQNGFDSTTWALNSGINSGFPYLIGNPPAGASPPPPPPPPPSGVIDWSVADSTSTYGTLATLGAATLNGVSSADQGDVFGAVSLFSDQSLTTPVTLSAGLHAGTYYEAVTGLTGSAADNYTLSSTGNTLGTLTIDPKTLAWTVQNSSSTYGTTPTVGSATLYGIVNGDNIGWNVGVFNGSSQVSPTYFLSAGTYTEKVTSIYGPDTSNYVLAANGSPAGTLTIQPKPLTWSVANSTSTYGSAPTLGSVFLFGIVSVDDVVGVPGIVGVPNPSATTPVGSYTEDVIGLAGSKAGNYVIATSGNSYGTLTIEQPPGYSSFVAQTSSPQSTLPLAPVGTLVSYQFDASSMMTDTMLNEMTANFTTANSTPMTAQTYYIQSGTGAILTADQIRNGAFPPGTYFVGSGTGQQVTQAELVSGSQQASQQTTAGGASPQNPITQPVVVESMSPKPTQISGACTLEDSACIEGTLTLSVPSHGDITLISYSNGSNTGSTNLSLAPNQCPQLIVRYANAMGLTNITGATLGNGNTVAQNLAANSNGQFIFVNGRGATTLPAYGAVLSLSNQTIQGQNWTNDSAGHVGIVTSVVVTGDSATVTLFDQNFPGTNWRQIHFTNVNGVWTGEMNNTPASTGITQQIAVAGWANPVVH